MNWKTLFLILFFNVSFFQLFGQQLHFNHLTTENGLPHNTVNGFTEDKYGFIWIATLEGLCKFDGSNIKTYYSENTPKTLINHRPTKLYRDDNGGIWVLFSTSKRVCKYNYETDDFSHYILEELSESLQKALKAPEKISYQSKGAKHIWSIVNNNLVQKKIKSEETGACFNKYSNQEHLVDTYVISLFIDSNDILWVGTDNHGVYYVDINKALIRHYTYGFGKSIRAICEDDFGQLWVGTREGKVYQVNREKETYSVFNYKTKKAELSVRKIYKDRKNNIWIGTKNGLYFYDRAQKIKHFTTTTQPSIPNNRVYAINEDKHGILWIGTWNGIASYNYKTKNIVNYQLNDINAIRNIAIAQKGGLWIATEWGLVFLDYQVQDGLVTNLKTIYYNYKEGVNSISNDFIYSVDVDDDGNVWIGTLRGLSMYDIHKNKFINFENSEFISNTAIRGVLCYKDYVWLSYNKGITRIHRKNFSMRHYDALDGLQNNEFSEDAYYKNKKTGELFFGGNNGLNMFYPDCIKDNSTPPKIVFTELSVQNQPVRIHQKTNGGVLLKKPLQETTSLEFKHHQNEFEISFSALHFSNVSKNRYAYKLEGVDENWIYLQGNRRSAIYSGVPSGTYTLKVKAANSDGVWNNESIKMQINILPAWWVSKIAWGIYILLLLLICYAILRIVVVRKNLKYQIEIEQIKAEKAKEISSLRTTFFTGISHEIRTPVTLIIDPLRKLIENQQQNDGKQKTYHLMYRNASRLLNLINQLLDFRKVETTLQTLRPAPHNIIVFITNKLAMFEYAVQKQNITLKLNAEGTREDIRVFDEDVFDKILVNLISNALKYSSNNTTVQVRFLNEKAVAGLIDIAHVTMPVNVRENPLGWFAIQVIDQGKGIAPEMQEKIFDLFFRVENNQNVGSGVGLALTKALVELHKGYITVQSEEGKGSCFTVFLPTALTLENEHDSAKGAWPFISSYINNDDKTIEAESTEVSEQPLLLIVEDNNDIRNYLKQELSIHYNIITANNGKLGQEKAQETIPDLVISDVMMPEMSGIELCKALKTDERTSHIPVILLTARQSEEARMEGYETGADDYVIKPFNSAILEIRIKNLIESRKKLRTLFSSGTPIELKKISINATDEKFINRAVEVVHNHLSSFNFTADVFAQEMAVSRAQLFRKIKAMTNQTVNAFIMAIKLNRAVELLQTSDNQINEIALKCGFSDASNFTRSFVKKFGVTPSNYKKGKI